MSRPARLLSYVRKPLIRIFFVCLFTLVLSNALNADILIYEQTSDRGWMDGLGMSPRTQTDSPSQPNQYKNSNEYYTKPGFFGRLVYQGGPATFTVSNIGPEANGTQDNRFYFTLNDRGTASKNHWREFFIVVRAKGYDQSGGTTPHFVHSQNAVIENNNGTFSIDVGAGEEEAEIGCIGYNTNRQSGLYDGSNQYRYKYPYRVIWFDMTIIRTNESRNISILAGGAGFYETHFSITSNTGLTSTVHLGGKYSPTGSRAFDVYQLTIEQVYHSPIPFNLISERTSVATALEIATIRYVSDSDKARVIISSDALGNSTDFAFTGDGGKSFDFKLAFQPTLPVGSIQPITPTEKSFSTTPTKEPVGSLVGSTFKAYRLEGVIKLYIEEDTVPMPGRYSSTIYVVVQSI